MRHIDSNTPAFYDLARQNAQELCPYVYPELPPWFLRRKKGPNILWPPIAKTGARPSDPAPAFITILTTLCADGRNEIGVFLSRFAKLHSSLTVEEHHKLHPSLAVEGHHKLHPSLAVEGHHELTEGLLLLFLLYAPGKKKSNGISDLRKFPEKRVLTIRRKRVIIAPIAKQRL